MKSCNASCRASGEKCVFWGGIKVLVVDPSRENLLWRCGSPVVSEERLRGNCVRIGWC